MHLEDDGLVPHPEGTKGLPYRCIMCGKEWPNKFSMRAHLKIHKKEMARFTVMISKSMKDDFTALCHAHGLTTCHVTVALLHAACESFRRGVTFEWDGRTEKIRYLEGANPLNVHINQTFLGKPRSPYKLQLPPSLNTSVRGRCPQCGSFRIEEGLAYTGTRIREGRCQDCGTDWQINPKEKKDIGDVSRVN
jgi:hypothetical protein